MGRWGRQQGWIWFGAALSLGACDVALLRGLSREEALELSAALDQRGVVARVVPDGASRVRLDVNEAAVADAVAALARANSAASCEEPDAAAIRPWIETAGEARARAEQRLERALAASLLELPQVVEARVHLTLPSGMRALPETLASPAASVLLVRSEASEPVAATAQAIVAGAVPGLAPGAVRVAETKRESDGARPSFARIGPIVVTKESEPALKGWIAGGLVVQLLLAAAVLRPLLRRRGKPANAPPV